MTEYTGSPAYIAFKGTALNSDFRELGNSETIDIVDASAGADVAKTYLTTLEDGTGTLTLLDQTGGTAATAPWQVCDKGQQGTLEWGPEGTATGKPRHYVNAIVTSRERPIKYNDVTILTVGFQYSGVVADTSY